MLRSSSTATKMFPAAVLILIGLASAGCSTPSVIVTACKLPSPPPAAMMPSPETLPGIDGDLGALWASDPQAAVEAVLEAEAARTEIYFRLREKHGALVQHINELDCGE